MLAKSYGSGAPGWAAPPRSPRPPRRPASSPCPACSAPRPTAPSPRPPSSPPCPPAACPSPPACTHTHTPSKVSYSCCTVKRKRTWHRRARRMAPWGRPGAWSCPRRVPRARRCGPPQPAPRRRRLRGRWRCARGEHLGGLDCRRVALVHRLTAAAAVAAATPERGRSSRRPCPESRTAGCHHPRRVASRATTCPATDSVTTRRRGARSRRRRRRRPRRRWRRWPARARRAPPALDRRGGLHGGGGPALLRLAEHGLLGRLQLRGVPGRHGLPGQLAGDVEHVAVHHRPGPAAVGRRPPRLPLAHACVKRTHVTWHVLVAQVRVVPRRRGGARRDESICTWQREGAGRETESTWRRGGFTPERAGGGRKG